jgi:hypothetical protein
MPAAGREAPASKVTGFPVSATTSSPAAASSGSGSVTVTVVVAVVSARPSRTVALTT